MWFRLIRRCLYCLLLFVAVSCSDSDEPRIVYITATPADNAPVGVPLVPTAIPSPITANDPVVITNPTVNPPRLLSAPLETVDEHIVQAGDTLSGIALSYGVSVNAILAVNEIINPDTLFVGQQIRLPAEPTETTPALKILSDARLIRAPGSRDFDIAGFIQSQSGYIRQATDEVTTRLSDGSEQVDISNAAQIIERVSLNFSVDPRLLLALLEHRAGWLSQTQLPITLITHPLISENNSGSIDRSGLYRQLNWAANILNFGYYGWQIRGWTTLEFPSGIRLRYDEGLNAGTVGVYYFLSLFNEYEVWLREIAQNGFLATYVSLFGDPFTDVIDPVVPLNLAQPELTFPFASGETWFFTGGAHGGWGSGSAWSAIDFAPPDDPPEGVFCYTSNYWARAVAPGLIVRSGNGSVVLDLDGDGDESTGWVILYLHIAEADRIQEGTYANIGDTIGRPACAGGFSSATHMHIARRFNGEWIPADCQRCSQQISRPTFTMSGWEVVALLNQEYQGYLDKAGDRRIAEQGRLTTENRVTW